MTLAHHRGGSGPPLVLIHGIGHLWQMWRPVLPLLEPHREVVALDLPGFGASPPLPASERPTAARLARAVAELLDELGWERPHVAGNSLGGWVALELARLGRAAPVTTLSPAGFAEGADRTWLGVSLRATRATSRALGPVADRVLAPALVRRLILAQVAAHPERLPGDEAASQMRSLARSPGWDATLRELLAGRFSGGDELGGGITIAWAEKDRLLPPLQGDRARKDLPRARHIVLPGCGHVPTYDDPRVVADAILSSA